MKTFLASLFLFFITFSFSQTGYIGQRLYGPNQTNQWYVQNSPGNTYTTSRLIAEFRDSTYARFLYNSLRVDYLSSSNSVYLKTDGLGNFQKALITDIFNPSNYYDKTASDARYLQSFTESDPLFDTKFSSKSTSDLLEGINLYYTDTRAKNALSAGTGLSYNPLSGQFINTSPDQIVTLSSGTGISVTGIYPSFTITNTAPSTTSGTVTSVGLSSTDLSVSGSPVTTSGIFTADLTTTGVLAGKYDWVTVDTKGRVTSAGIMSIPVAIASGTRNFNQAYQISSTDQAQISISVSISCNLSLSGGQAGNVQLQISPNGTSGWITMAQVTNGNTGTLTIGLNTTQVCGGQLTCPLPVGYYWRATTTNTTGTPTYTFNGGNEITY